MFSWPIVKGKAKEVQNINLKIFDLKIRVNGPLGTALLDLYGVLKRPTYSKAGLYGLMCGKQPSI